jgi:hypothetical protein
VAATLSVVIGAAAAVQVLIDAPGIIKTLTLPFIISLAYTSFYTFRLSRMDASAVKGAVGDNKPVAKVNDMSSMPACDKAPSKKIIVRVLVSASVIGSQFFLWAMFVNWGHGSEQAMRAGAGQGSVSFMLSMGMAFLLEIFFFLPGINKFLRIPFAVAATLSVVIGAAAVVHVLIGAPWIIKGMTLPLIMGVGYTSLYSFRLSRMDASAVMGVVGR